MFSNFSARKSTKNQVNQVREWWSGSGAWRDGGSSGAPAQSRVPSLAGAGEPSTAAAPTAAGPQFAWRRRLRVARAVATRTDRGGNVDGGGASAGVLPLPPLVATGLQPPLNRRQGATGPALSPTRAPPCRRHRPPTRRCRATPPLQAAAHTHSHQSRAAPPPRACPPPPPPTVDRWSRAAAAPPTASPHPTVGPPTTAGGGSALLARSVSPRRSPPPRHYRCIGRTSRTPTSVGAPTHWLRAGQLT